MAEQDFRRAGAAMTGLTMRSIFLSSFRISGKTNG